MYNVSLLECLNYRVIFSELLFTKMEKGLVNTVELGLMDSVSHNKKM